MTEIDLITPEESLSANPEPNEFQLEQLFGSKTRVRLLHLFLDDPARSYYVRELTRRIEAQLNSVRRELENLVALGIVLEVEGKILAGEKESRHDKKKYYQANTSLAFFAELRGIMKKATILMNKTFVHDLNEAGRVDLLFLTGKFVDETRVPSDLLIVGEIEADRLQAAIKVFETQIGREINYTYMPKEEFLYRREVKDRFLNSLLTAEKVTLINNFGLIL